VGTSSVQSILDGCTILENWSGKGGMSGKSFNSIDPVTHRWKQSWVDSAAQSYDFAGEPSEGHMVFTRQLMAGQGRPATIRMTLSKRPDGSVDQLSERSEEGKTWVTEYEFTYVKK
jgi:hypothetical protein